MAERTRILILGGTAEAAGLARALAGDSGVTAITSLAGRTRAPAAVPGAVQQAAPCGRIRTNKKQTQLKLKAVKLVLCQYL